MLHLPLHSSATPKHFEAAETARRVQTRCYCPIGAAEVVLVLSPRFFISFLVFLLFLPTFHTLALPDMTFILASLLSFVLVPGGQATRAHIRP